MQESHITKVIKASEFEAFINTHDIVFVDFWATWCAPCRQFGVVYEKVAAQYPTVTFSKVNIEEEQALAEIFHIRSIPHLMVFKQGIAIYSEAGSMPESTLKELVQQAIDADVTDIRKEMDAE
jgi:thioredoxin 1